MDVNPHRLEAFMGRMVGHMTGAALCYSIWLGDELGLYRELAGSGPRTADSLAGKTGCHPRLVREWLDGQAAGGLVAYDPAADTYELGPEAAMALADEDSPVFVAPGHEYVRLDVHGRAEDRRDVPGRRRDELGRPSPVPLLRHGVVLPDRIPGSSRPTPGSRRSTASTPGSRRASASPTSGADTGRRS